MPKAYFISDAHLGLGSREQERAKEDRLLRFLRHAGENSDQLFIVGDLFDAWIEYRTVMPKGFHRTLAELDRLIRHGVTVHYFAGNHDYWLRNYFRDEIGMIVHFAAFETVVNGKRLFIHHGDGLSRGDSGYKILKKILRNHFAIWLYSWIHPDVGVPLARRSSRTSRVYTSTQQADADGMLEFARTKINEGYDAVILGHSHTPTCTPVGNGLYVNLGDWITHDTYAELDQNRLELKKWK